MFIYTGLSESSITHQQQKQEQTEALTQHIWPGVTETTKTGLSVPENKSCLDETFCTKASQHMAFFVCVCACVHTHSAGSHSDFW